MITADTADKLDQLGLLIFDPKSAATGLHAASSDVDGQLAALIKEPMKVIDGRDLALGFKYTLNVTNALQLRAKHWYLRGVSELDSTSFWPCTTAFEYIPQPGFVQGGSNSFGWTIGLATCAAICHTWAIVIRKWLAGDYPLAVNQP
jgi:hypothetical protein